MFNVDYKAVTATVLAYAKANWIALVVGFVAGLIVG